MFTARQAVFSHSPMDLQNILYGLISLVVPSSTPSPLMYCSRIPLTVLATVDVHLMNCPNLFGHSYVAGERCLLEQ